MQSKKRLFRYYLFCLILLMALMPIRIFSLSQEFDFFGLQLGMTEDDVTTVVVEDSNFQLDRSRYLGFINEEVPFTLKAYYYPYIDKIYIDFFEGYSYQLTIQFSEDYFDYYTLSDNLSEDYGNPSERSTTRTRWTDPIYSSTNIISFVTQPESNISPTVIVTNIPGDQAADEGEDIRMVLEYPTTLRVFDNVRMEKMFTEYSQLMHAFTNDTVERDDIREIYDAF